MNDPKRPAVSVRAETYERLKAQAKKEDTTVNNLVERMVTMALDYHENKTKEAPPEPSPSLAELLAMEQP